VKLQKIGKNALPAFKSHGETFQGSEKKMARPVLQDGRQFKKKTTNVTKVVRAKDMGNPSKKI